MSELAVTPTEELDLIVKYLEPNSSVEAKNIKACHTGDSVTGRFNVWRRLEERYDAPSLVEASIRRN